MSNKQFIIKKIIKNDFLPIEVIEIKTINLKKNLNLMSIYIPPNFSLKVIKEKFNYILNNYKDQKNTILGGEINAHNSLQDLEMNSDRKGNIIAEIINDSNCCILNNGDYTYYKQNGKIASIDITLGHIHITHTLFWKNKIEHFNSDDFVLEIDYIDTDIKEVQDNN